MTTMPEDQVPDHTPPRASEPSDASADQVTGPSGAIDALPVASQALLRSLHDPWLLAAWPGMGGVGAMAAGHLAQALGAQPVGMVHLREQFPIEGVEVRQGIARANPTPRCLLLAYRDPRRRRDLLILLGEAQPAQGGAELCGRILDMAQSNGVTRVVTFAAMGSDIPPVQSPRVLGATTAPTMLEELNSADIERLADGQISGLNGALLAVAAERGVPAACLLGEMPAFAAGMPNPRASLAVLTAFRQFADIEVDLTRLESHAEQVQPRLEALHEQIQTMSDQATDEEELASELDEPKLPTGDDADRFVADDKPSRPTLDAAALERIETLFARATADRAEADRLKAELDRLGAFAKYENRFLDLFRRPS